MSSKNRTKQRSVLGPGVGAVAVIAKNPSARPPEFRILEERRKEEARAAVEQTKREVETLMVKQKWNETALARSKAHATKRLMASMLQEEEEELNMKRERLRKMLAEEERMYMAEVSAREETPLDKQARLRERVRVLREEREQERQDQAHQLRRLQLLRNNDRIRDVQRKNDLQSVLEQREAQLAMKKMMQEREQHIDSLYQNLWEEDMRNQDKKERHRREQARLRMAEQQRQLSLQMEALTRAREAEEMEKEKETQELLRNQALLLEEEALERERQRLEREKQRAELDLFNSEVIAMKQQRVEAEKEADQQMVQDAIESIAGEADRLSEAKQVRMREAQMYNQYTREIRQREKEREAFIDAFMEEEQRKAGEKHDAEMRRREELSRAMLLDAVKTRERQIAAKEEVFERERQQAEDEYHELLRNIDAHERLEKEKQQQKREIVAKASQDIIKQAQENRRRRLEEQAREEEEIQRLRELEEEQEREIMDEMSSLSLVGHRL